MNPRLLELAHRHGALQARIVAQRQALATQLPPIEAALAVGDSALEGVDWLKHHPGVVGAAVAALVLARPSRVWRWGRRGFFLWQGWRSLREKLGTPSQP